MSGFDMPLGSEIAAALLATLAAALSLIARSIARAADAPTSLPTEPVRGQDIEQLVDRVDALERTILTRIDQHERQVGQIANSVAEALGRAQREKEIEDRRAAERIMDKIDRLRNGHG